LLAQNTTLFQRRQATDAILDLKEFPSRVNHFVGDGHGVKAGFPDARCRRAGPAPYWAEIGLRRTAIEREAAA